MFTLNVGYPNEEEEFRIIEATTTRPRERPNRVVGGPQLLEMQQLVRRVPAAGYVIRYAMRIARLTRPGTQDGEAPDPNVPDFVKKYVTWGAGPRAGQNLILAAKARALLHGRTYVATEDVKAIAMPVMRHRIVTNYNADADRVTPDEIVRKLLALVPARAADRRTPAARPGVARPRTDAPPRRVRTSPPTPGLAAGVRHIHATPSTPPFSPLDRLETGGAGSSWKGYLAGKHRSPRQGLAVEFAQHREYAPRRRRQAHRLGPCTRGPSGTS
jgi:MoxR-like ATPase